MASLRFLRLFFGDSPYGHAVQGDLQSLDNLGLADLQDFYRREFTPATATLVVVGMVAFDAGPGGGRPTLGRLARRRSGQPALYRGCRRKLCAPGIYLLDRPDLTQSEIRVGHLGLPRAHPDYFPLKLVNYILGEGGFSSRLMARIRSDLGFTYGIRSSFSFRRAPGPFTRLHLYPGGQHRPGGAGDPGGDPEVHQNGVTAQELAEAQSYYVGHFPLGLETPRGIARQVLSIDLYDLGRDYLKDYCEQIRNVTWKPRPPAAQDHLHPEALVTLVMGPAARCAEALRELGPVQIIDEI